MVPHVRQLSLAAACFRESNISRTIEKVGP